MARRNPNDREKSARNVADRGDPNLSADFDIYQDLARLQDLIFESYHVPMTRWTLIDEGQVSEQIEIIYETVPESVQKALALLEKEREILSEAEEYAARLVRSAQQRAAQILDESGIIQQAERQAAQIREQVRQECEAAQQQTLSEIERMRQMAVQELQQLRQQTVAECQEIQSGADEYSERVLGDLERQLGQMLQVVRNGRQQVRHQPTNGKTHLNERHERRA
ncbi:ATP synthase F0 subunit B [Pannus brasiliensis CCIBt3594]|uniref:ATP synthase F0 subunit B n=1 Tax=Pannus brasiliensis CCIBt3594 TaxID=1427578 RepID=A0AAW9QWY6_9CHRO